MSCDVPHEDCASARALSVAPGLGAAPTAQACTGISLTAADGIRIVAGTVEWALGDAHHDTMVLFPRAHAFQAQTPEGYNGLEWIGRYGFLSIGAYGEPYGPHGMTEGATRRQSVVELVP